MKRQFVYLTVVFVLVALALETQPAYAGNAVVGTGTPASCTEAAFDTALASIQADSFGGVLSFNCGGAAHTIDIFTSATIFTPVEIDGGGLITLFAQGASPLFTKQRFFEVVEEGHLTLRNIRLEGARSPAGTGWGSQGGSIVVWDDTNDADPYEYASLNLYNVQILNSASTAWGGAIANEGGVVRIENSLISGSSARWGGAYNGAHGVDTFIGTTISGSSSTDSGGGLRFWNSLNSQVIDSTVSQNSSTGAGGGIENVGGRVTVRNSYVENNVAGSWGGGVKNSYNEATSTHAILIVEDSSIAENRAAENGGGIDSNDTFTVRDSTLRQNTAKRGGGVTNWGGQMTLVGVTFDRNTAENGGGIYQYAGGASITGANLSGNSATVNGGGLYLEHILGAAANWVNITASKLIGNLASTLGGAIFASTAYLTLDNSEIANNSGAVAAVYLQKNPSDIPGSYLYMTRSSVHDNPGGGIYNRDGTLLIGNSTVSQNIGWGVWAGVESITTNLGFTTLRGNTSGQLQRTGGNLELTNSVLDSGNIAAANCSISGGLSAPTVAGTWSSDGSCGSGPIVSSSLLLGPLALNGGATPNHLPQPGSAVINQVGCGSYTQDQRGAVRPGIGSTFCDAGAVETGGLFPRVYLPSIVR